MRILVTNDDGINAHGLKIAESIACALTDDVWVVAPESEQSGASHSLTLLLPVRLRKLDERHFSLTGTPTDCVMMATAHLMKDTPPDLVLSGVNRGVNLADDVTYSGTVAGAMEGASLGIPSIALSQGYPFEDKHHMHWACAETHGPGLVKKLLESALPRDVLINVNFPDCPPEQVTGIEITRQGKRSLQEVKIVRRIDMRGYPYFWIGYNRDPFSTEEGTDLHALVEKRISVTPLHLNLTEAGAVASLKRAFAEVP